MPIDPISAAVQGTQLLGGLVQTFIGARKQHKATKALERLKTPVYEKNKAIGDYYQTALNRYNTNPYQSQEYQYAQKQAQQNLATGIGALGDRRNALAGVSSLVNATDNNLNRAGIAAEQQRNQNFGALGSATNMQAGEDRMAFQQNQLAPYQKKFGLLSQKAAAGGQLLNAGLSNAFGGLSGAASIANAQAGGSPLPQDATSQFSYQGGLGNQIPSTYNQYRGY